MITRISLIDIMFDIKLSPKHDNWRYYILDLYRYCNYGNIIEYFCYNKMKDKDKNYSCLRYYLICG